MLRRQAGLVFRYGAYIQAAVERTEEMLRCLSIWDKEEGELPVWQSALVTQCVNTMNRILFGTYVIMAEDTILQSISSPTRMRVFTRNTFCHDSETEASRNGTGRGGKGYSTRWH